MSLKLYRISQTINKDYDTYDSAVVVAESEEDARGIHPSGVKWGHAEFRNSWCMPNQVQVDLVGTADELFKAGDVVCASFNAG